MVDAAGDMKYSVKSAVAYAIINIVFELITSANAGLAQALGGFGGLVTLFVVGPLLFAYAGYRASKEGGKAIADCAVAGLGAGLVGGLIFAAFNMIYFSAMTIMNKGQLEIAAMLFSMASSYLGMIVTLCILGLVAGAIGGLVNGGRQAKAAAQPRPSPVSPQQPAP